MERNKIFFKICHLLVIRHKSTLVLFLIILNITVEYGSALVAYRIITIAENTHCSNDIP